MNVGEYSLEKKGGSQNEIIALDSIISATELEVVLSKITNCIDNIEDSDQQLESFFKIYESFDFTAI